MPEKSVRTWAAFAFFWSAYAPLALIVAARDVQPTPPLFGHPWLVLALLAFALLGLVVLRVLMRSFRGQQVVVVTDVRLRSNELINYAIPYLVTFLQLDLGKWQDLVAFGLFMLLLFILTLKTSCLFINPALAMVGYELYEIDYHTSGRSGTTVVLSKISLAQGNTYRMDHISRFLKVIIAEGIDYGQARPSAAEVKEARSGQVSYELVDH